MYPIAHFHKLGHPRKIRKASGLLKDLPTLVHNELFSLAGQDRQLEPGPLGKGVLTDRELKRASFLLSVSLLLELKLASAI